MSKTKKRLSKKKKVLLGLVALIVLAGLGGAFDKSTWSDSYYYAPIGGGYNGYGNSGSYRNHRNWNTGTSVISDGETMGVFFDDGTSVIR